MTAPLTNPVEDKQSLVVRLICVMGGDRLVAMCAWSSTEKWEQALTCPEEMVMKLIRSLMRNKHASPFGHPHMTLFIRAPLPIWVHILRHRSWASFSLLSLRYTLAAALGFMPANFRRRVGHPMSYKREPLSWFRNRVALWILRFCYFLSFTGYAWLIKLGVAEEQARFLVPEGTMTQGFGTVSLRNALNFLVLRDDVHAQGETREIAIAIRNIMEEQWPITMLYWEQCGRPQL